MTIEELLRHIKSIGLVPVSVEKIPERETDLAFAGTLDEYLVAVQSVGASTVFVSPLVLSKGHFFYRDDSAGAGVNEDVDWGAKNKEGIVDLCTIVPKLTSLKARIGVAGQFDMAAPMARDSLTFAIVEDWFKGFMDLRWEAVEKVEQRRERELNASVMAEEEENAATLNKLRALIDDPAFLKLRTQVAMIEYARDKIGALVVIDDRKIKHEIQILWARIEARGLRKR